MSKRLILIVSLSMIFLSSAGIDVDAVASEVDEKFMSAFVRAVKPGLAQKMCCGPTCCG